MSASRFNRQDLAFAVLASLLAAVSLIVTMLVTTRGVATLGTYAAVIAAAAFYLRRGGNGSWQRRWSLTFTPLMIATVACHGFLHVAARPGVSDLSPFGHLWRLVVAAVLAAAVSMIVATLRPAHAARSGSA